MLTQVALDLGRVLTASTRVHNLAVLGAPMDLEALLGGGLVLALPAVVGDPLVHGLLVLLEVAGGGGLVGAAVAGEAQAHVDGVVVIPAPQVTTIFSFSLSRGH